MATQKKSQKACQSAITCLKLTIETLEEGVKYVQSNDAKRRQTYFTPCSSVSIIDSEQVNADWDYKTS